MLAPWRHYLSGQEIEGWRAHDETATYPISRVELLRPLAREGGSSLLRSGWGFLTEDLPLKLRVLREVQRIVREHGINVICVGELNSGSWIGVAARRLWGCRMVSYIHGEEVTAQTSYRLYGRNRRRYLQAADAVVAVSDFTRRALLELMGVPPGKIELIHNGVDTQRFSPGPRNDALLERLGVRGRRVILSVGRLVPRKGMDKLIEALPRIRRAVPDVMLLIVGEGDYREELQRLIDANAVQDNAVLVGKVSHDELVELYRSCDFFAMPNRHMPDGDTEGFGLVFLEANACGKAVIGGRAGGAVEAVRDGENGLLVDGAAPHEIADAAIRLLTDDALRKRMEARAIEIATASSCRVRAAQFHALCQRLVRKS